MMISRGVSPMAAAKTQSPFQEGPKQTNQLKGIGKATNPKQHTLYSPQKSPHDAPNLFTIYMNEINSQQSVSHKLL